MPSVARIGAFAIATLGLLGTTACAGKDDGAADGAGSTTNHGGTSTSADETSEGEGEGEGEGETTATDTDDSADTHNDPTGSFYAGPAVDWGGPSGCDPWYQDCPEGEKCVPYASSGGTWDANKCVPILGDGQVGEPCVYDGRVEATDTCGEGSVCRHANEVDGEQLGECMAFCKGDPSNPKCDEGSVCVISHVGSSNLCAQACDPLAQDCPEGLHCYANWAFASFACWAPQDPTPAPGAACSPGLINDCPAGSACMDAMRLPACEADDCCTAYCSLAEPDCPEPGAECVPLVAEDPPAELEDLGFCGLPD